jgi:Flp pilus assembly protein TadG
MTRPPTQRRRGSRRRVLAGERGAVSAELVIATPLLLVLLLAIVQFALWSHATHLAQSAAAHGLAAARAHHGSATLGTTAAEHYLDRLGPGPLTAPHVHTTRGTDTASVRISGHVVVVIPFLRLPVQAHATGPVERLVPETPAGDRS